VTENLLVLESVSKTFDGTDRVLDDIDFSVAPHEVVCVIGPSGSGKSTLLKCVNLIEPVTSGRIYLEGTEITSPHLPSTRTRCANGSASSFKPSTFSRT
jgi:polar amino acid transport system ATP-binding protein